MALGTAGLVALGMGAAGTAGGVGAAIKAARMKTDPRGVQYGGSEDEYNAYQDQAATGLAQGNQGYTQGVLGLQGTARAGQALGATGQGLMAQGQSLPGVALSGEGSRLLQGYKPGQMSALQSQAATDQGALQNLGAARSGGALGLRNALNANAGANVQNAQNAGLMRAQEEQQYLQARVGQANQDQANAFQANQQLQAQRQGMYGLGASLMQAGNGQAQSAYGNMAQAGLNNQGQYMDQQTHLLDADNQNRLAYEQTRQANQARRSDRLFGLASGLMSGGMSAMSGAVGGK